MKKIFLLLVTVAFPFHLLAQPLLLPINWGNFPSDYSYGDDPYEKMAADAYLVTELSSDIDDIDILALWSTIEPEYYIAKISSTIDEEYYPYDLDGEGTLGASFKVCYTEDAMYVLTKLVDKNDVFGSDHTFEIYYQTRYKERYEPGYLAATTLQDKNEQYGRFLELGGSNNMFNEISYQDWYYSSLGRDGTWQHMANVDRPLMRRVSDGAGTDYYISQFLFDKQMFYLADEWGSLTNVNNRVSFDPAEIDTISFEIRSLFRYDNEGLRAIRNWSANNNDVYKDNYYAGYLVFHESALDQAPPILLKNPVLLCQGAEAYPLEALGNSLKWYTDTVNKVYTTDPPVPVSDIAGTTFYYVTQVMGDGNESGYAVQNVTVYNLESNLQDMIMECSNSISLEANISNNLEHESIQYLWSLMDGSGSKSGSDVIFENPGYRDGVSYIFEASTSSGCYVKDTVHLTFSPLGVSIPLLKVDAGAEGLHNQLLLNIHQEQAIDSIIILFGSEKSNLSGMDTIPIPTEDYYTWTDMIHVPGGGYYAVSGIDICGNLMDPVDVPVIHHPALLDTTWLNSVVYSINWNEYEGRPVATYELYRGIDGMPGELLYHSSGIRTFNVVQHGKDTTWFRLVTRFPETWPESGANTTRSSIIKLPPSEDNIVIDTIFFYDTINVVVTDTVWSYANITVMDSLVIDVYFISADGPAVQQLLVYPNPTKDYLVIRLADGNKIPDYRYRIIDPLGSVVADQYFTSEDEYIDLRQFGDAGFFYLQIFDDAGTLIKVTKIILI